MLFSAIIPAYLAENTSIFIANCMIMEEKMSIEVECFCLALCVGKVLIMYQLQCFGALVCHYSGLYPDPFRLWNPFIRKLLFKSAVCITLWFLNSRRIIIYTSLELQ